jgi:sialate O-acetylesterase
VKASNLPTLLRSAERRGRRAALTAAVASVLVARCAFATVSLEPDPGPGFPPALFSHGMVLQRNAAVPIWGKAAAGEQVSVTIAGQTKTTTTPGDGHWRVVLDPLAAGGPYQMTIAGTNTIVLTGVLVGDVWVCSGQSNMVIHRARRTDLEAFPDIHTIGSHGTWSDRPSAVAFRFARELKTAFNVPIGIINRAAGGTAIRSWLPQSVLADSDPDVQAIVGNWDTFGENYVKHVAPFAGYAVRGFVWWQGEQDLKLSRQEAGTVDRYYYLLPALIRSWRAEWQRGNLPFVLVQLPTGGGLKLGEIVAPLPPDPPEPTIGVLMRHSTFHGLSEPSTALTVSIDIDGGTHPKDHDLYGHRIANAARGSAYGQVFPYSGPIYSSMTIESAGRVRLRFKPNTAAGLHGEGGALQGFAISADGQNFVWAQAQIQNDNEVVVWDDAIANPAVVRYGWDREPKFANLFNGAGLGAAPFSTGDIPTP